MNGMYGRGHADTGAVSAPSDIFRPTGRSAARSAVGIACACATLLAMACSGGPGMLADETAEEAIAWRGPMGTGGMAGDGDAVTAGGMADGTAGDPGVANAGGGEDASGDPVRAPRCIDDPADVALIGDSYVSWVTHSFVPDLAAETGQNWRSYAVGGNSMATGGIFGFIPAQLDQALLDNPNLKLLVMDGGGNDILVPDTAMFPDAAQCTQTPDSPTIEDCRSIVEMALDTAESVMNAAADAGVEDVVYFFYPHIPGGGLISGPHPNEILDYALPLAREVCDSAIEVTGGRMKCHFVDMVPAFEGKTGLFADVWSEAGDGVHPNTTGSKVMAAEVWRVMQEECLAQPTGSGCCVPAA